MAFLGAAAMPLVAGSMIAGTGLQMFGQMQQAKSQAAMAEYGAAMQRQQAGQLKKAGEIEYQRREQEGQKLLSKQMSLYGASGIEPMEGSPLMVMETTAAEIERDALMARYKYQLGAHQAGVSAALQEFQAKAYKDALPWQMAGTMFSGLGSAILPFVKGKTLLTGLSPLLGEAEWKPFSK